LAALRACAWLGLVWLGAGCLDWSKLENGACGDGFVGREEQCDDGNRFPGDGCDGDCNIEPPMCGNGRPEGREECDDGNELNNDACVDGCHDARCGDGFPWDVEEQCDDGNTNDGDGCSSTCQTEQVVVGPRCGDGHLDPDEACDDGNTSNADSCLNGCSFATCGDGQLHTGVEECDDANTDDSDGCSRGCMLCGGDASSYFRIGNGHCYTVHAAGESEGAARTTCQAEGGDIWTVTSQMEGGEVRDHLRLLGRYWLGLHTGTQSNSWITGEDLGYTNFAAGEPSDTGLKCVAIDTKMGAPGTWASAACQGAWPFVCERWPAFTYAVDHHAYRFHADPLTADAARQRCTADGGHLAVLDTNEERLFVAGNVNVQAWVDASDALQEGQFVWPTGQPLDPTWWAVGQPDDKNGTQECLVLNVIDKVGDAACGDPHAYICEFD
jgi:cysteine-rich repeat protein